MHFALYEPAVLIQMALNWLTILIVILLLPLNFIIASAPFKAYSLILLKRQINLGAETTFLAVK